MRTKMTTLIILAALLLSSCGILPVSQPTINPDSLGTQVAATLTAMPQQGGSQDATPARPTATWMPTSTAQSQPTATLIPPTPDQPTAVPPTAESPKPTATRLPATAIPVVIPCDRAGFVKDVTISDGYTLRAGQVFTKTWRLINTGTCTWSKDYDLVFYSGDHMSGVNATDFKVSVTPGQSIDLSVRLTAPSKIGRYTGYWMLRNASGSLFGIGDDAKTAFWVNINVLRQPEVVYEFVDHYCEAVWANGILGSTSTKDNPGTGTGSDSGAGTGSSTSTTTDTKTGVAVIPCSTHESGSWGGPIVIDAAPKLESGEADDEKALVLYPHFTKEAILVGTFPAFSVKSGDRFLAVVGCMYDAKDCQVTFTLEGLLKDGTKVLLGTWKEKYDGSLTKIDVDLKPVADKSVQLILTVKSTGTGKNDHIFWLRPRIMR